MIKNNLLSDKLTIFIRRVSTDNQSLEMQMAADRKFRDLLDEEEYIEINELGISANKVKLKHREQMQLVINMIQQNKVNTVYVYDRSRLARNFYEYIELVDLFIAHNINVIFTTTNLSYPPFSCDYLVEGINGILIEEEGKAIARRISDTHKKLPNKKFGYDITKENGRKNYTPISLYTEHLQNLFKDAVQVEDLKGFVSLINKYEKVLKRPKSVDVMRILTDPFYCGCELIGHRFNRLSYVIPIISIEDFSNTQQNIEQYVKRIYQNIQERHGENVLNPICDKCRKRMYYRKDKSGETGMYTCSNKHPKISITVEQYNSALVEHGSVFFDCLDRDKLKQKGKSLLNQLINKTTEEIRTISAKIETLEMEIVTLTTEQFTIKKRVEKLLSILNSYKQQRKDLKETRLLLENHKNRILFLINKINLKSSLSKEELLNVLPLLIKNCFINEDTLSFHFYFNEFLKREEFERRA
ncbi:recombinase family protein [Bacillus zanthoxyli]|nr:recombinase family protein [Bacillus zanthoxyli]